MPPRPCSPDAMAPMTSLAQKQLHQHIKTSSSVGMRLWGMFETRTWLPIDNGMGTGFVMKCSMPWGPSQTPCTQNDQDTGQNLSRHERDEPVGDEGVSPCLMEPRAEDGCFLDTGKHSRARSELLLQGRTFHCRPRAASVSGHAVLNICAPSW